MFVSFHAWRNTLVFHDFRTKLEKSLKDQLPVIYATKQKCPPKFLHINEEGLLLSEFGFQGVNLCRACEKRAYFLAGPLDMYRQVQYGP